MDNIFVERLWRSLKYGYTAGLEFLVFETQSQIYNHDSYSHMRLTMATRNV
jgi:hypothetical protein